MLKKYIYMYRYLQLFQVLWRTSIQYDPTLDSSQPKICQNFWSYKNIGLCIGV